MTGSFVLQPLQIAPMNRISPSRFTSLRQCVLSAACTAGKQPRLLPASPKAILGTISHRLLELAARGELPETVDGIRLEWDSMVAEAEVKLGEDELERRWLPLSIFVQDYQVRRARACNAAHSLQAFSGTHHRTIEVESTPGKRYSLEQALSTEDGLVGGVIDCLILTPDGWVVRDYKTGPINDASLEQVVKVAYEVQLKIYAALVWLQKGCWPARLELVPLDGLPVTVPFEPNECLVLLQECKDSLIMANDRIRNHLSMHEKEDLHLLATASPSACRYCPYRPGCQEYWQKRNEDPYADWTHDVRGVVQRCHILPNGNFMMQISAENQSTFLVRGKDNPVSNPYLRDLGIDKNVAIYNLSKPGAGPVYEATTSTTMYVS